MKEMQYLQCPFCGWCRPVQYGGREVRFDKVDPEKVKVLQTRQLTGGKGGGHITIVDSKSLNQLEPELNQQITNQCHRILKALS